MVKQDEQQLLAAMQAEPHLTADVIVSRLAIPRKRAAYILDKWEGRGWYECGSFILYGRLTDEGKQVGQTKATNTNKDNPITYAWILEQYKTANDPNYIPDAVHKRRKLYKLINNLFTECV